MSSDVRLDSILWNVNEAHIKVGRSATNRLMDPSTNTSVLRQSPKCWLNRLILASFRYIENLSRILNFVSVECLATFATAALNSVQISCVDLSVFSRLMTRNVDSRMSDVLLFVNNCSSATRESSVCMRRRCECAILCGASVRPETRLYVSLQLCAASVAIVMALAIMLSGSIRL